MSNQDSTTAQDINIQLPEISITDANQAAMNFYDTAKDYLIDQNYWIPITAIIV